MRKFGDGALVDLGVAVVGGGWLSSRSRRLFGRCARRLSGRKAQVKGWCVCWFWGDWCRNKAVRNDASKTAYFAIRPACIMFPAR